ncbi:MAG: hypothetical protein ACR2MG_14410 [Pyrinomonadaceae bacterium]
MNMIIDVVMKADLFQLVNINVTNSKIVPYCPRGIKDMVDQIIATVGNDKIAALRIWSHGITHWKGGEDYEKGNISLGINNVDADNVKQHKSELNHSALKVQRFEKGTRIKFALLFFSDKEKKA